MLKTLDPMTTPKPRLAFELLMAVTAAEISGASAARAARMPKAASVRPSRWPTLSTASARTTLEITVRSTDAPNTTRLRPIDTYPPTPSDGERTPLMLRRLSALLVGHTSRRGGSTERAGRRPDRL